MSNKPARDVTQDWQATQGQKSSASRLRLFAALCWIVAIGGEIAGIYFLYQHKFDHGNMPLLIGLLVGIAIFAIAGTCCGRRPTRTIRPAHPTRPDSSSKTSSARSSR